MRTKFMNIPSQNLNECPLNELQVLELVLTLVIHKFALSDPNTEIIYRWLNRTQEAIIEIQKNDLP